MAKVGTYYVRRASYRSYTYTKPFDVWKQLTPSTSETVATCASEEAANKVCQALLAGIDIQKGNQPPRYVKYPYLSEYEAVFKQKILDASLIELNNQYNTERKKERERLAEEEARKKQLQKLAEQRARDYLAKEFAEGRLFMDVAAKEVKSFGVTVCDGTGRSVFFPPSKGGDGKLTITIE